MNYLLEFFELLYPSPVILSTNIDCGKGIMFISEITMQIQTNANKQTNINILFTAFRLNWFSLRELGQYKIESLPHNECIPNELNDMNTSLFPYVELHILFPLFFCSLSRKFSFFC